MILRNLTSTDQTVSDGDAIKTVTPLGLVAVSAEVGSSEQPLVPPAPASA